MHFNYKNKNNNKQKNECPINFGNLKFISQKFLLKSTLNASAGTLGWHEVSRCLRMRPLLGVGKWYEQFELKKSGQIAVVIRRVTRNIVYHDDEEKWSQYIALQYADSDLERIWNFSNTLLVELV